MGTHQLKYKPLKVGQAKEYKKRASMNRTIYFTCVFDLNMAVELKRWLRRSEERERGGGPWGPKDRTHRIYWSRTGFPRTAVGFSSPVLRPRKDALHWANESHLSSTSFYKWSLKFVQNFKLTLTVIIIIIILISVVVEVNQCYTINS